MQEAHDSFMKYLRENPNNFSYWFPHVRELTKQKIAIPQSAIIPIDEDVYRSFFLEREGDEERIDTWIMETVKPVIESTPFLKNKKVFAKNGCFSNKFNFSNGCLIENADDEETLINNICNIQSKAVMHETDGYLELVLREYIEAPKGTPTIYNGMPLRPEARLFYDFDRHQVLYAVNYWDWDYCHDHICYGWDGKTTPDADVYEIRWPYLAQTTKERLEKHIPTISKALSSVDTLKMPNGKPNIWSVDFILEEDQVWLIDMAQGWRSVYWDADRALKAYREK